VTRHKIEIVMNVNPERKIRIKRIAPCVELKSCENVLPG
jgi:hypothetical protein